MNGERKACSHRRGNTSLNSSVISVLLPEFDPLKDMLLFWNKTSLAFASLKAYVFSCITDFVLL